MEYNKASLFKHYIKMRQHGLAMDDVVNTLQEGAQSLPEQERSQLGALVMEWEDKYGINPRLSAKPAPILQLVPTRTAPSSHVEAPVQPHAQRLTERQIASVRPRILDALKASQSDRDTALQKMTCPHCGVQTAAQRVTCHACSQPIRTKPAPKTRRLDKNTAHPATASSEFFTVDAALLVTIRGVKGVIEAFPREKMVVGRGLSPVPGQPFLDLAPFGAELLGVSRSHVEIRLVNDRLVATDLDSGNGTFVNGVRLHPFEIRVLHHNDELRLGKLVMKVSFKVPD